MQRRRTTFMIALGVASGLLAADPRSAAHAASDQAAQRDAAGTEPAAAPPPPALVPRGEGELPLPVPRGEELVFRARVSLGPVDARVGTITLSSGVEPFRQSLLFGGGNGEGGHTAWVRAEAKGKHAFYTMDSTIESRFQPQSWPALVHSFRQEGTERRRREILLGIKDGVSVREYRSDTSSGAPRGTRVWRTPQHDPAPFGAVDSISSIYLLRAMLAAGDELIEFPMLDKERLWWVRAELGDPRRVETHAGIFNARSVKLASTKLDPEKYAEQIEAADRPDAPDPEFEGPFGIRGDIRLWVEERTGVPVWIEGDLPIGIITLGLDIRLESYRGTPVAFQPVKK